MNSTAIEAQGLRKRYGDREAIADVSLSVPTGTVFGLLGPNGAGKTTTIRILATLLRPDAGHASVAGFDVVTQGGEVRRRIGLTGQYSALDERLTAWENLVLIGRLHHMGKRGAEARARELLAVVDLESAAKRPVRAFSGGMRRRLDLAASLIAKPPVIFLDEPTTGLDLTSRLALWAFLREQVAGGATLLLTTQYLEEADQLADRIAVLDAGRVIADGTPDELKRKVGGEWLEVTLADPARAPAAMAALANAAASAPTLLPDGRTVTAPMPAGVRAIATAASALDSAGIEVVDFALRRASLDDVFLALTGASARAADDKKAVPA